MNVSQDKQIEPVEAPKSGGCLKKLIIAVIGLTVIAIGVLLLVLPGPGLLVIAGGISILALEFAWARRLMHRMKGAVKKVRGKRA
jgi:tellurite resistance protein TerC